jgi:hypothetical protein
MPRVGYEPTTPAFERGDGSCLRPRGHCDRLGEALLDENESSEMEPVKQPT